MTARCPSDLALETHLLDPERSPIASHVDGCARCRERVALMREQGDEFRRFVFPSTVSAVEGAAARRRRRLAFVFAPVGTFAALAAALLLFVRWSDPAGPAAEYLGVKGDDPRQRAPGEEGGSAAGTDLVRLTAFVNAEGGARAVGDGAAVPPSSALRFQVSAAGDCFLWILSIDGKGEVSRLYPPKGTAPTRHSAGAVPGGAVLDGDAGPERLYAVCAPETMAWSDVRRAAPPADGPDSVRRARALGEPLAGALQATLLIEKRP